MENKNCINCLFCRCIRSGKDLGFICSKNIWKQVKNDNTLKEFVCDNFKEE